MKKTIILSTLILAVGVVAFSTFLLKRPNFLGFPTFEPKATLPPSEEQKQTPFPSKEDIIRNFFALINERRITEAIQMLSPALVSNKRDKQAWEVQFNSLKQVEVTDIKKQADLNGNGEIYRVDLQVKVASEAASASIPYYGWLEGKNVRWITVVNEDNLGKIAGIATGP